MTAAGGDDVFGALRSVVSGDRPPQWSDVWPLLDRMSEADRERYGAYALSRITEPRVAPHRWLDEAARTGNLQKLSLCDGLAFHSPLDPETVAALLPRLHGWETLAHVRLSANHHAGLLQAALSLIEGRSLQSLTASELRSAQDLRRVLLIAQRAGVHALSLSWRGDAGDALDELEWLAPGALHELSLTPHATALEGDGAQRLHDALRRLLASPAVASLATLDLEGVPHLDHGLLQALGALPLRALNVRRTTMRWGEDAPALPLLERLSLNGVGVSAAGLARTIATSPALHKLTVRATYRAEDAPDLSAIKDAQALRALDVVGARMDAEGFAATLARCATIFASGLAITGADEVPWPETSPLEQLTLIGCDGALWTEAFERVRWPKLRALGWSGRDEAPLDFKRWSRLERLRDVQRIAPWEIALEREGPGWSVESWRALLDAGLPLEALTLSAPHARVEALREVLDSASLRTLRALRIPRALSPAHLRAVLTWPGLATLRELELGGELPDAPIAPLLPPALALESLTLHGLPLSLEDTRAILARVAPGALRNLLTPSPLAADREALLRLALTSPACHAMTFLWLDEAHDAPDAPEDNARAFEMWCQALASAECDRLEYVYGFLPDARPAAPLPWPEGHTWPAWLDMS